MEEKEEAALKLQSDFSLYRATHMHSESDYQSQICRIHELEQVTSWNSAGTVHVPRPIPTLGVTNSLLWQSVWALMDCSGAIRQAVVSGEAPTSYCSSSAALASVWFTGPLLPPATDWLPAGGADSTLHLPAPF